MEKDLKESIDRICRKSDINFKEKRWLWCLFQIFLQSQFFFSHLIWPLSQKKDQLGKSLFPSVLFHIVRKENNQCLIPLKEATMKAIVAVPCDGGAYGAPQSSPFQSCDPFILHNDTQIFL